MPQVPNTKLRQRLPPPTHETRNIVGSRAQREALWGVVRKYTGHPLLMQWASDFLREYAVPARDNRALASAVQRYSQEHIRFMRERPERFASPMRTIEWGFGDCDDKSVLIATVLRSFRVPVRLVFIRYDAQNKDGTRKKISHVFPEVKIDNEWLALESVHPWPMGKSPVTEAVRKGYQPTVETIGP